MKRTASIGVVVVLVAGLVWAAFGDALRPVAVDVAPVTRGVAVAAVYGSGTVEPVRTITLRAPVAGDWQNVEVDAGSRVTVEERIGQLDVAGLTQDLQRAEVDLAAAEDRASSVPGVSALRAEAAAIDARIALARLELERADRLAERGVGQAQARDRLAAEVEALEAERSAASARRRDAAQGIEFDTDRYRLLVQRAQVLLERTIVRAPFDGIVLERLAEPGEWVAAGHPLVRIGDVSRFVIEAEIDEADVATVLVGQGAVVSFYVHPDDTYRAVVTGVATDANRDRDTFDVTLELDERVAGLRPGLSAEVNIVTAEQDDALLVPNAAFDGDAVWRVASGRVERVEPVVGIRGATHTRVVEGLDEGDSIVVQPPPDLADGARVRAEPAR